MFEEIFCSVIEFFDLAMPVPKAYGLFHICSVILTACTTFFLCRFCGNANRAAVRRILLVYALICIALEIYKQISFTFDVSDGVLKSSFQWYAFPFQFCSIPMYVALICAFVRNDAVHDALISFMATFGVIAGVLVLASPSDVFIDTIGINIQTMVHHGGQTAVGLYLLINGGACKRLRAALGGVSVFLISVTTALVLDLTVYHLIDESQDFNMFFISPYYNSTLPVYSSIQPAVPYPVFLFLYVFPFVTVAMLIYALRTPVPRLIAHRRQIKTNRKSNER